MFLSIFLLIPFAFCYIKPTLISFEESLRQFFSYIIILPFIIAFSEKEKNLFLKLLINSWCCITCISLIAFTINVFIYQLPHVTLIHPNGTYHSFTNYFFFVNQYELGFLTRFSGILAEPGHMGMVCAILLYINGYKLKNWQNVIMTIALIWSFSLAGYVLYFVGLLIHYLVTTKHLRKVLTSLTVGSILTITTTIIINTYYPESIISSLILSRLEFDSKGGIKGNNRNTSSFDNMYNNFLDSSESYFGIPPEEATRLLSGTPNSSYKVFIMQNGILGFICLWLFVIGFGFTYPSKLGFGFIVLIFISFLQRPYLLWEIESFSLLTYVPLCFHKKSLSNPKINSLSISHLL